MTQKHKIIAGRFSLHSMWRVNGIYHARIRDYKTGKVRQFSTRERSKRKAEQRAIEWIEERIGRDDGVESTSHSRRFDESFTEWLGLRTLRPKVRRDYETTFRGIYEPEFGDMVVEEIRPIDLERFLKKQRDKGRTPRTIQFHLATLRAFLRWTVRNGYRTGDPTDGIPMPKIPKRQPVTLTYDQARHLLRVCQEPIVSKIRSEKRRAWTQTKEPPRHLFLAILIALHTGLRKGNITGLRWRHVDLGGSLIAIPAEEMKANADLTLPIHPELQSVFVSLLRGRSRIDPDEHVLGTGIKDLKRSWHGALQRAGIPKISFHAATRKTFASWIGERATYTTLKALLGHMLPDVTGRYVTVSIETMRDAVNALPPLLTPDEQSVQKPAASASRA